MVRAVLAAASNPVVKSQFAKTCVELATVATWQEKYQHNAQKPCGIGWS